MESSDSVKKILKNYESDNHSTLKNLNRIFMNGKLSGTGKLVILPVDQGFEHGPDRSFAINPEAYDPHYHFKLALEAGLSAFAAPVGLLEAGVETFKNKIPLILKCNSANSLTNIKDQGLTGGVKDALKLGCVAVGFTIYPASDKIYEMIEEAKNLFEEAKNMGLVTVLWSYPRGNISKKGETAINIVSYAAHMAALCGAHIIKVKLPSNYLEEDPTKDSFIKNNIKINSLSDRVKHIIKSCFNGRRVVVFSGGEAKNDDELMNEIRAIKEGGGHGSIIGRNSFQRPKEKAIKLLNDIMNIYKINP